MELALPPHQGQSSVLAAGSMAAPVIFCDPAVDLSTGGASDPSSVQCSRFGRQIPPLEHFFAVVAATCLVKYPAGAVW